MHNRQSGNVLIIVLITVTLLAALIMVFSRSSEQGTGNMSTQQAKLAAQELVSFFAQVDAAVQRLRAKGCSENDISFANSGDTGAFVAANDTASAPGDFSCHIFRPEGGKITFNMNWTKYQIPQAEITPSTEQFQWGNIYFKMFAAQSGVGTAANDFMAHLNFTRPEICAAFNQIQNPDFPSGSQAPAAFAGRYSYCVYNVQIQNIWVAR